MNNWIFWGYLVPAGITAAFSINSFNVKRKTAEFRKIYADAGPHFCYAVFAVPLLICAFTPVLNILVAVVDFKTVAVDYLKKRALRRALKKVQRIQAELDQEMQSLLDRFGELAEASQVPQELCKKDLEKSEKRRSEHGLM